MAWRPAISLTVLRNQLNTAYPKRSKASDGMIGDASHASGSSDHNPNAAGVVTAFDITHDPKNGLDAHGLADRLLANRHPNLKYIISNDRIAGAWTNWKWAPYQPKNPKRNKHTKHIHVSVGRGEDGKSTQPYDDTIKWNTQEGTMPIAQQKIDSDSTAQLLYQNLYMTNAQPTRKDLDFIKSFPTIDKYLRHVAADKNHQQLAINAKGTAPAIARLKKKLTDGFNSLIKGA